MAWHTPGPWRAHTLPNGSHHIIADHWGASVAVTMFPESGSEGREANARVIAAAPDLLAFAKRIASLPHHGEYVHLIDEARAVIEKATRAE